MPSMRSRPFTRVTSRQVTPEKYLIPTEMEEAIMKPIDNIDELLKDRTDKEIRHGLRVYGAKACHRNRKQLREVMASQVGPSQQLFDNMQKHCDRIVLTTEELRNNGSRPKRFSDEKEEFLGKLKQQIFTYPKSNRLNRNQAHIRHLTMVGQ